MVLFVPSLLLLFLFIHRCKSLSTLNDLNTVISIFASNDYEWDFFIFLKLGIPKESTTETSKAYLMEETHRQIFSDLFQAINKNYGTLSSDLQLQIVQCLLWMHSSNSLIRQFSPKIIPDLDYEKEIEKATGPNVVYDVISKRFLFLNSIVNTFTSVAGIISSFDSAKLVTENSQLLLNTWIVLSSANLVRSTTFIDPFGLFQFALNEHLLNRASKISADTVSLFIQTSQQYLEQKKRIQIVSALAVVLQKFPTNIPKTRNNYANWMSRILQQMHGTSFYTVVDGCRKSKAVNDRIAEVKKKIKEDETDFTYENVCNLVYDSVFCMEFAGDFADNDIAKSIDRFVKQSNVLVQSEVDRKFPSISQLHKSRNEFWYFIAALVVQVIIGMTWLMQYVVASKRIASNS